MFNILEWALLYKLFGVEYPKVVTVFFEARSQPLHTGLNYLHQHVLIYILAGGYFWNKGFTNLM